MTYNLTLPNYVFVVDANRVPMPMVAETHALHLLRTGQAAKLRHQPMVLILKKPSEAPTATYQLKIDPGSRYTGFAIVDSQNRVVFGMELEHRGEPIKQSMVARASIRRTRRGRKTRYRQARFDNRTRPAGWLPPSIQHRVDTTLTWVNRFLWMAPIGDISVEQVKFDMALMRQDIENIRDWTKRTQQRYSLRGYLAEKYNHRCMYCDVQGAPMEIEHLHPVNKGGTTNLTNLGWSCRTCNQKKSNKDLEVFLAKDPTRLAKILKQSKIQLKDAAAVNSTRLALVKQVQAIGLPVEIGTGCQTAFNRSQLHHPKAHWIDAACVGDTGLHINLLPLRPLLVKAMGHGNRQVTRTDRYGFPITKAKGVKHVMAFIGPIRTGDIVHMEAFKGKYLGRYPEVRIASINTTTGYVSAAVPLPGEPKLKVVSFNPLGISRVLQRNDGYRYAVAA